LVIQSLFGEEMQLCPKAVYVPTGRITSRGLTARGDTSKRTDFSSFIIGLLKNKNPFILEDERVSSAVPPRFTA